MIDEETKTEAFSTLDLVQATGATERQIRYWHRRGAIRPTVKEAPGSGRRHSWSAEDRREVAVLAALQGLEVSKPENVQRWIHVLEAMRREPSSDYLVTDGFECQTFGEIGPACSFARSLAVCTILAIDRLLPG